MEAVRKGLQQLASLRDALARTNEAYWAEQVEIQQEVAAAWLTLAEDKKEKALQKMRAASDHEGATDKHPVTPGVILPARDLLGEMLLELKQPAQALGEFEATLGLRRTVLMRWLAQLVPPRFPGTTIKQRIITASY